MGLRGNARRVNGPRDIGRRNVMVWRIKSINHVAIPSHEGEWSYDTEATFENAVRDALADRRMQLISATLHDGSVLDVAELKRRYGPSDT